ncbi:MAG TPA: class I SAM-dependent methyltransferase [Candidatus Acidoferrum sp.]|nr:class I SAM-dependent methyltransferase [Candidatus Acidoferrum sp.]
MSSSYDKLKEGMRWMWSLGDYPQLAKGLEPHAEALAEACQLRTGDTVLDVAAGNGNFALAAARRGAVVTASDLTPRMVDLGRARSAAAGTPIEWTEGDAEELPFSDARFEVVGSVFGAMFAPRPDLVASELFRVVKPGGLVAMANYSPGGFLGKVSEMMSSFSARPALDLPSPFVWGDEGEVRKRFAGLATSIEVIHRRLAFESSSVDRFLKFWEETNGPHNALKAMLPPDGYQKVVRAWVALVNQLNETTDGSVEVSSPYILVLARNRKAS